MKQIIKLTLSLLIVASVTSCGGKKTEETNKEQTIAKEEQTITRESPPMDLYFMCPLAMLVSPGGGDNSTAYIPDFVNYPNDLVKFGLRGHVKECVAGVSTIKYTYKFNPDGNLTNYQFRMDSKGTFGEGAKLEYDSNGNLTLLGRDFRGQSPNSHTYTYIDGVLSRRSYGSGYREYTWVKNANGKMIPKSVVTHGLVPPIDIKYTHKSDGNVFISEMTYNNPSMPRTMTAKSGTSTFEYLSDGRLKKVKTSYKGCSNAKYREMYGICEYTYNEKGDVASKFVTLYDSSDENRQQLYTETISYTYTYDNNDNWITVKEESSHPQAGNIPYLSRTITYYSEEELSQASQAEEVLQEKIFIGKWEYRKNYQQYTDGETEMVIDAGTITLNLYDKFTPKWSKEPILGVIYSRSTPSLGMEQVGTFVVVKANVKGNEADVILEGYYSKDVYSAKLEYNPNGKALLLGNLQLIRKGKHDQEETSDFEAYDLEPFKGMYFFLK